MAQGSPDSYRSEEAFPLVRRYSSAPPAASERLDEEIDVSFDDTALTPPPTLENLAPTRPAFDPIEPVESTASPPSRVRPRVILSRAVFAVVMLGVLALLAYEISLMTQNGMQPF